MAANSAILIVRLSGNDLIYLWVVVCVRGLTIDALSVGFHFILSVRIYETFRVPRCMEWNYGAPFRLVGWLRYVRVGVCIGVADIYVLGVFFIEVERDRWGWFVQKFGDGPL